MSTAQRRFRILIVDDHPMVREGLAVKIGLQPDLEVCGEAATTAEGHALVRATHPDLMIVDIALKNGNGLDLIKQVHAHDPQIKSIVISGFDESLYAERSLRAGAMGYLNKQETNDKVIEAIRSVLAGKRFVSAWLADHLVQQAITGRGSPEQDPMERLTDRELEVFRLIGEGQSTGAIARQLHLSPHTIDTHRANIREKLGVSQGTELVRRAVQWVLETR